MNSAWYLQLWPSLRNPSWRRADAAAAALGDSLTVSFRPTAVRRKLDSAAMMPLKQAFMVTGLETLPAREITSLYTYLDMADVAQHGDNLTKTRLYRWLRAAAEAGRAVQGRAERLDTEERILSHCRGKLDLYRSLREKGYSYQGPDDICLGILPDGSLLHMRRGTHRMTAAQLLELPSVTGKITHVDRRFAERAVAAGSAPVLTALRRAIQDVASKTLA